MPFLLRLGSQEVAEVDLRNHPVAVAVAVVAVRHRRADPVGEAVGLNPRCRLRTADLVSTR